MKKNLIPAFLLFAYMASAQSAKRPDNWFNLDATTDKVQGVSTEKTYKELLKDKTSTTVVVGVLDSGVDYNHEDLKSVMWSNPGEIPGNNVDDDKNGYVDDVHGWNFIGGRDGRNVEQDNLEMTRLVRKYHATFAGKNESDLNSKEEKELFRNYQAAYAEWSSKRKNDSLSLSKYQAFLDGIKQLDARVKATLGVDTVRQAELMKFTTTDKNLETALEKAKKNLSYNPDMMLDQLA